MPDTNQSITLDIDTLSSSLCNAAGLFNKTITSQVGQDLSAVAWRVLESLAAKGPQQITVLAHQQSVSQPTMTGLINKLEANQFVSRTSDPTDGRAQLIKITPTGHGKLDSYHTHAAEIIRPLIAELPVLDRAAIYRTVELMQEFSTKISRGE